MAFLPLAMDTLLQVTTEALLFILLRVSVPTAEPVTQKLHSKSKNARCRRYAGGLFIIRTLSLSYNHKTKLREGSKALQDTVWPVHEDFQVC